MSHSCSYETTNLTIESSPPKASSSTKKRALGDASNVDDSSASSSKAPKAKKVKTAYGSYQDVVLEGEMSGEVPVYDCCTTIRKKINKYLTEGHTAAAFLRDIGGINSNALARVYPAAYMFFEKHRIFDNKPKTPSRKSSEVEFPRGRPLEQRRYHWVKN
ncbi:hypothetical protein RQP46_009929 [Phenoliferia psychrophenolica]